MNYLLINNEMFLSDGSKVKRIKKENNPIEIQAIIGKVRICLVDVDVLIAAAVESPVEKKDSLLVRKFTEFYQHESYIIQDERIDSNLFQVIGIKEQKVREVYSLISPEKVESIIPYAIAIRQALTSANIDLNKTIVFVDDFGSEMLLTVFDGLKFSRTRVIVNTHEDLLPEIKRSQIDFFKKNEEYLKSKGSDFIIVVNNIPLADEIRKNAENLTVVCINLAYPALEGLKEVNTAIKYILPEEIIKKRKEIEFKKRLVALFFSLWIVGAGILFYLFNKFEFGDLTNQCASAQRINERLEKELRLLDRQTYREDLRRQKQLNYGLCYKEVLDLLPVDYDVSSFKFTREDRWQLDILLLVSNGGFFDPIPSFRILKNIEIKDVFVNNQPGKRLRISL